MVGALVTPAAADPGNGHAYGHDKNGDTVTTAAPAPDPAVGTGANQDCGAYCPSGVGLPSGNGNGDGNATGKPCAGCVGNADGKNPPGQFKDGATRTTAMSATATTG